MTPYFEARNLRKTWPGTRIDFSCSVEKGKMLGITGRSGSGKSTVLRIIAGLLEADCEDNRKTGTAAPCEPLVLRLDGCDISRLVPAKRNVGMVFQSAALFPHMRVDDNVAYGLRCAGMSKKQSHMQAADFLKDFGLEGFAARYPESLSGGEAQRVSLARTLIVRPPLYSLTSRFRRWMRRFAKNLLWIYAPCKKKSVLRAFSLPTI